MEIMRGIGLLSLRKYGNPIRLWQITVDAESAGGTLENIAICGNITQMMIVIAPITRIVPRAKSCLASG